MHDKTLRVRLDKKTFPKAIPTYLKSGSVQINMLHALLMLGSVTVPGGFSVASPAMVWAWIRYFSALSPDSVLRLTKPFVDLDPHQKSVISDDFGVAVTTQWLSDSVKGFKQVVDGRQFILNYSHLLSHASPPTKKIGARKSPDFVIMDASGKWHVIECKGTQSGLSHSVGQINRAREQKAAIAIKPKFKGTSLAAGLYLASEQNGAVSTITVHDPEPLEPLIRVESADTAFRAACRVTAARSFGLSGLPLMAYEAAFVDNKDAQLQNLFTEYERSRNALPLDVRIRTAYKELAAIREGFSVNGQQYSGRQISLEFPWPPNEYQPRRIVVRQGIRTQYLDAIRGQSPGNIFESLEEIARNAIGNETISISGTENDASLRHGQFFISTIRFD